MAQRISQHNFLPDLDIDLEVGSFNLYSLGSILLLLIFTTKKNIFINSIKSLILSANPFSHPSAHKMGQN